MLKAAPLLQLLNQIFIKRDLKFRGQFDLVRLDHHNGDRGRIDFRRLPFLRCLGLLLVIRVFRLIRRRTSERRNAGMRAHAKQFALSNLRRADGRGKDYAVKPSIRVPVLNRKSIQFGAEQTHESI